SLAPRREGRQDRVASPSPRPRLASPKGGRHPRSVPDELPLLARGLADRYRVIRELGRGGMATVYLVDDLKHDRRVALKVLSPEIAAEIGQDRFRREIEIAARTTHPHIVPLFDSGAVEGRLYYV